MADFAEKDERACSGAADNGPYATAKGFGDYRTIINNLHAGQ